MKKNKKKDRIKLETPEDFNKAIDRTMKKQICVYLANRGPPCTYQDEEGNCRMINPEITPVTVNFKPGLVCTSYDVF